MWSSHLKSKHREADERFSPAECVDLETFLETEVQPTDPFKPFDEEI